MKLVFMLVLTLACHHEAKKDLDLVEREQDKTAKTTEETRAETKKQDATDVDTKTTKSDNAVVIQEADGSSEVVRVPKDKPLALKKGAKVVGTVALDTVVVDQRKRIGATVDEKAGTLKSTETGDKVKDAKVKEHEEEMSDVGFSWKFYLLAGGCLAAVVALGIFLSHSKLIRRLLGEPL